MDFNIEDIVPVMELDNTTDIIDNNFESISPKDDDVLITDTSDIKTTLESKSESPENFDDVATAVFDEFVQNGIAEKGDKEKYNWEDVTNVINHYREELPDMVAQSIVSQTPKLAQDLIDYVFTKGESLSEDDLKSFYNEYINDLANSSKEVNLSTVDTAREYLSGHYKEQGYRQSVVDAMLDALEDEQEGAKALFDEAKKINDKEKSQKLSSNTLNEAKQKQAERKTAQKEFTQNVINELKNTGWSSNKINQIRSDLATKKTWDIANQIMNSPKGIIRFANLMKYWNEEKQDFVLDDFLKQVQSKEVKSLKDKINQDMIKTGSSSGKTSKRTVSGNLWEHLTPVT